MMARRLLKRLGSGAQMLMCAGHPSLRLSLSLLARASLLGTYTGELPRSLILKVVKYGMSAGVALVELYSLVSVAPSDDTAGHRLVMGRAADVQLA
jgi:hypothetical protein